MGKELPFKPAIVTFSCTSCGKKYEILSAHKESTVNIDICSNCHPFYLGQTNLSRSLGPAEKLKSKFDAGKNYIKKKG
ncbi:50S ribosomal protein L31 [Mycoplasma haemocanis str. Illinois]|uniref:50S ribosomal protein L31 n=1 Tax=Mycoplasma haemocanis (strain Illinois) TaxID=1111676 RepID=H6N8I2_MYCHN|nr:50S ribosomal protein L31 [Mycoplasma haemocanis]AEW45954.1 50S ribosomal protein L31 [Mycoplasma haemocanis str. Illinois]